MASLRRNVIFSILFVLFGGPGIILFFLPLWITHFHLPACERWWQILLAGVLIAIGLTPALESVHRFVYVGHGTLIPVAPPEHLVVSGFYRYVRNPMYVGVMVALAGEAILFENRSIVIEMLLAYIGFNILIRLHEEPSLTRRYADEYLLYKRNVPRWFPRLSPWGGRQS
jgi:protein-S-isoprenylcysteine O-methyltransferase Ste14